MTEKDTENEILDIINKHKKVNVKKKHIYKIIAATSFITLCIISFLYISTSLFSSQDTEISETAPWGKIISPAAGTTTGEQIIITGETKNLESGHYVWLAVDKPRIGLCWPKQSIREPDTKFRTTIFEGGPYEPYMLSLYILNKTLNDQWQEWVDKKMFGGLPMPPDARRLDSVKLILKK